MALFDRAKLVDGRTSLLSSCCGTELGSAPDADAEDDTAAGPVAYRLDGCSLPRSFFGLPNVLLRLTMLVDGSLVETTVPPVGLRLTRPGPPRSFCHRFKDGGRTTLSDRLPRFTLLRCDMVLPASEALSSITDEITEGVRFLNPKPIPLYPPTSDMTSSFSRSSNTAGAISLNCTLLLLPEFRALLLAMVSLLEGLAGVKVIPMSEAAEPRARGTAEPFITLGGSESKRPRTEPA